MQFIKAIVPLFLALTLTSAAPIEKRTTAALLTDIASISSDVATLTADALAFTGSLIQALELDITVDSLESSISSSKTAAGTTAYSVADSASVLAAITTLAPKIVTLLADLDAKSTVISSSGYTSIVSGALSTLSTDTDALIVACASVMTAADATSLSTLKVSIDAAFATSIATF